MKRINLLLLFVLTGPLFAWAQVNIPGYAISTSKHYRESGVGNAQGRAGSASMTARALLGKDGKALVEVTTGTLDSTGTPPGSFAKVQFKPLDPNGNTMLSVNYTPLSTSGGYYSFTWPSLYRHEQVQLQGNIQGIDRNRNDVVTVVDTVKLRPDLAVENLSLPSSAVENQPVNISANIVERNGDASATTTCQLTVDGSKMDTINNVYVDAGGSVSCAFTYKFTSTGSHNIGVTAANVVPGDWDTGNNTASGSINITNPGVAEHAAASFWDGKGEIPLVANYADEIWYNGSPVYNLTDTYGDSGEEQQTHAQFSSGGCAGTTDAVPFSYPVSLTYTETMDGNAAYSFTDSVAGYSGSGLTNVSVCNSTATSFTQQYGSSYSNDHFEYVVSWEYLDASSNPLYTYQYVQFERRAGSVTYFSYGYECLWWGDCSDPSNYYSWNTSGHSTWGTLIPLGTSWVPSISAKDSAGNTFTGSIQVSLTGNSINEYQPNTCYSYGPDASGYSYQYCSGYNYDYTNTSGSASQ